MEAPLVIAAVGAIIWVLTRGHSAQERLVQERSQATLTSAAAAELPAAAPVPASPAWRPATMGSAEWVPLGTSIDVRGRTIDGGVYVGDRSSMSAVANWGRPEPALVDPRLRVDDSCPDTTGATMDYWPAYDTMTPAARAAYLDWLAAGRPGGTYIGYPFLFFAGIERRVLVDAQSDGAARDEIPALLEEVERLLDLYGDNDSFHGYATGFLAAARLVYLPGSIGEIELPRERNGWELPVEIQLAVGAMVEEGKPIPAEWALAWLRTHPEIWLRTPAQRCPDEFGALFMHRYRARYGEGLRIRRPQRRLTLRYRPASGSFGGSVEIEAPRLPDISRLRAPVQQLAAIAGEVTESLAPYSRYVGRTSDRDSLTAIALLPPELVAEHESSDLRALIETVERHLGLAPLAVVPVSELTALWSKGSTAKMSKREAVSLAELLEARGYGIEPDARSSSLNLANHGVAVAWRLDASEVGADMTPAFTAATAMLRLGVTLARADGEVSPQELARLEQHIESVFDLSPPERRRLDAHLQWLIAEPLGRAGLKRQLAELEPEQRQAIGRLLIAVAAADGHLHAREMAALSRGYEALGLNPAAIHSDLHSLAAGDDPVPILKPDSELDDRAVPPAPAQDDGSAEVTLDRNRIARVLRSTEEVSAVLSAVFADDEGESPAADEPERDEGAEESIGGLDAAHSELVRRVASQPIWSRTEFEALAETLGLLPAGAIEAVNELAFEVMGEPLLEGEEDLEVNGHALKELLDV